MRVEYINPFAESAFNILKEIVGPKLTRGDLYLKSTTHPLLGITVIVGLEGDIEGRVLIDMSRETALAVASVMNGEDLPDFDDLAKATISELANMITAQAVAKLYDLGLKFDLSPAELITGQNLEGANAGVETLIVPIDIPQGKVEINVAIRQGA